MNRHTREVLVDAVLCILVVLGGIGASLTVWFRVTGR